MIFLQRVLASGQADNSTDESSKATEPYGVSREATSMSVVSVNNIFISFFV